MRHWKTWAVAVALLFLGAGRAPYLEHSTRSPISRQDYDAWREALRRSYQAGLRKDYAVSLQALEPARSLARKYPAGKLASMTWMYEGNAFASQLRFATAMNAYGEARAAAVRAGDREMTAIASHNLSSIYTAIISQEDALQWTESMRRDLAASSRAEGEPWMRIPMLLQQARASARRGDSAGADSYFRQALEGAAFSGTPEIEAIALERIGVERFLAKDLDGAEEALYNAFRIRRLSKEGSMVSVARGLSNVLLARGKPKEALTMAELALRSASRGQAGYLHFWSCLRTRALALWELGRKDEAIANLRDAADSPHLRELPADSLRVASVAGWHRLFELLVELTAKRYFETGQHTYLLQSLAAAEADRAFALRQAAATSRLPESRWPLLAQYQDLYRRLYLSDSPESRQKLREIRLQLAAEESAGADSSGKSAALPAGRLGALQPRPGQLVVVFYAANGRMYRWSRAPGGPWILDALEAHQPTFDAARLYTLKLGRGEWDSQLAARLFRDLFGSLKPDAIANPDWLLVPDDELFRLPFATLLADSGGKNLLDDHSVQVLPGVWALETAEPTQRSSLWIGVGDPIYNDGDPRTADRLAGAQTLAAGKLHLARLPGTGRELAAAASAWRGEVRVLTGKNASGSALGEALGSAPAVIHLATHVLPAPDDERESLLALSLGSDGAPEFVGPAWISARRVPGSLVVMSGCRSGGGLIRPGEGLLGLTRAWLYAGARSVVATHWPLLDDSGEVWEQFYRDWGHRASPAKALREAQLRLRRLSGWRAEPSQWGAYFLVGLGD